jgi:hypothetical protein
MAPANDKPGVDNERMRIIAPSRPNEQRKVENLLVKLAKLKPASATPAPAPILGGNSALRSA